MQWLFTPIEVEAFESFGALIDDWMFVAALGFFIFELVVYALKRQLTRDLIGDAAASFVLFFAFLVQLVLLYTLYLWIYEVASAWAIWSVPTNVATILLCLILADKAYYWEHRVSHEVNLIWATHTVHHSSPHYNISVAYRFGPMDALVPIPFHLPLVLVGFNPFVVVACEALVQSYQTLLHTEVVRRFPRPIEWLFNTPSHHRAHHGSNDRYLDKNYGGILIIWDRLFGTFQAEEDEVDPVKYGLVKPIDSNNPLVVWFHGYVRLWRKASEQKTWGNRLAAVFRGPGWEPPREEPE